MPLNDVIEAVVLVSLLSIDESVCEMIAEEVALVMKNMVSNEEYLDFFRPESVVHIVSFLIDSDQEKLRGVLSSSTLFMLPIAKSNDGAQKEMLRTHKYLQPEVDKLWKTEAKKGETRAVISETTSKKWIIFDGPVDTLWVESLNTVLDDSKTLCLPNRKRIKLTDSLSLLFEVQDLQQASPATVSRCGMVYVDDAFLTWSGIINRWLNKLDPEVWPEWLKKEAQTTFEDLLPPIIEGIRDGFTPDIPQPTIAHVQNVLRIVDAILTTENGFFPDRQNPDEEEEGQPKRSGSTSHLKTVKQVGVDWVGWVKSAIFYAVLWGIGGNLRESEWEKFDTLLRDSFCQLYIPIDGLLYEVGIDIKDKWLCQLEVPDYQHSPNVHFNSILVPTIDTVRYGFLVRLLIGAKVPVLVTGETGVGKTVILEEIIRRKQKGDEETDRTLSDDRKGTQQIELSLSEAATPEQAEPSEIEIVGAKIGFSAQTSSNRLQTMIEKILTSLTLPQAMKMFCLRLIQNASEIRTRQPGKEGHRMDPFALPDIG
ncbi:putative Dynein axonemal heavy chain 6 [Blattamonas nauphoetae]|uniref:Dynein axonemal heavy chain 6 n=1 Tax=Blattamonas nauphoetae TaxID=2049346 RepID=A0ABQ9WTN0_9EUKA|nr:putative Dynein axonemal heavy chain 6 [Blattamonas nauphoetae]